MADKGIKKSLNNVDKMLTKRKAWFNIKFLMHTYMHRCIHLYIDAHIESLYA